MKCNVQNEVVKLQFTVTNIFLWTFSRRHHCIEWRVLLKSVQHFAGPFMSADELTC
jgi:hypothetical protein